MNIYFRSFKVGNYFQLKCSTSTELSSNVVYNFSCPCDTAIFYIGYTTRHLITRAHEHLNLNLISKSAIKDHIYSCSHCSKTDLSVIFKWFIVSIKCLLTIYSIFNGVCLFILYCFYSMFGLIHKLKFCIIIKFFLNIITICY